ncbi:hypothetical protein DVH24_017901 [Malus domestica]|uniref:Uncharacterized protein n=1 Tax=Malus domestica TaxID=3750 RepID=A0A498KCG1_MALDO|nr:hypothetical protein DVH24_017901 [Malus domestica]
MHRMFLTSVTFCQQGTEGVEGLALPRTKLNGEYKHLPNELIWLCWHGFPLKSIPDDFINQPRLVVLDMQFSQLLQVWEGSKVQSITHDDILFLFVFGFPPPFYEIFLLNINWGRRIVPRLRQTHSLQPHSLPQTRHENLPVLFQPRGPAVSDRREQISDSKGAYDPSSNQIMSSTEEQLAVAVHDHDLLGLAHLHLSSSLDTPHAGRHIQRRSRRFHSHPRSYPQNLPVLLQRQPYGPAVSDSREQISDSMGAYDPSRNQIMSSTEEQLAVAVHDHDPLGLAHLRLSLSLDTPHAGCHIQRRSRQPHSHPRSCPQNLPVLLQRHPHGPVVSDSGELSPSSPDFSGSLKRTWVNLVGNKPMKENLHDLDPHPARHTQIGSMVRHDQGSDAPSSSGVMHRHHLFSPSLSSFFKAACKGLEGCYSIPMNLVLRLGPLPAFCEAAVVAMAESLVEWTSCGFGGIFLNGIYDIPDFEFVDEGKEADFDIPQCNGRDFKGLTLCLLYSSNKKDAHPLGITTKRTALDTWITWASIPTSRESLDYNYLI